MRKSWAIANYDNRVKTGYLLGDIGTEPKRFISLIVAVTECEQMNNLPHAAGRTYHVVDYPA